MVWLLQTPDEAGPKLLGTILAECGPSLKGGAAFAFASAQGIKLLAAEPVFDKFLKASEFSIVVGLDAITDTRAVDQLRKLQKNYPNLKPKLFLHKPAGSIFHPKTMWLKTAKGGVIITGSGNLTSGGLKSNWEAMAVEKLTSAELAATEKMWDSWINAHSKQLRDLDDPEALQRAKENQIVRTRIKRVLERPEEEGAAAEAEIDVLEEIVEDVEQDVMLHPVLVAEVPANGPRWKQVGFSLNAYQQFFGVTLGTKKYVHFYQVLPDGSLAKEEERESVEVRSKNYRFEVGAAIGLAYPAEGHPIVIFEKIASSEFKYVLLMPPKAEHTRIQKFLDDNYSAGRSKRRVQVTLGDLQKVWPEAPFFL